VPAWEAAILNHHFTAISEGASGAQILTTVKVGRIRQSFRTFADHRLRFLLHSGVGRQAAPAARTPGRHDAGSSWPGKGVLFVAVPLGRSSAALLLEREGMELLGLGQLVLCSSCGARSPLDDDATVKSGTR
jgi:hypothetical protein